jgi:hypothetical protein
MADVERWTLCHRGHTHILEVRPSGLGRRLVWSRDDEPVAERRSSDDRVQVTPDDDAPADAGALGVRFGWVGPARRVTLFEASDALDATAAALVGLGGLDFEPEPGSKAARREAWIRAHPRLFTARQTLVAVAAVVVPILVAGLLARFAFSLPWPDWHLPRIPWPDLPSIPWPSIPWPDVSLPDVNLPAWVREVLAKAKYVGPVVLAFVLARGEIRRRRQQDRRRNLDSAHDDRPDRAGDDRDGR